MFPLKIAPFQQIIHNFVAPQSRITLTKHDKMKLESVQPGKPKLATYLSLIAVVLFMGAALRNDGSLRVVPHLPRGRLHKECVDFPHIRLRCVVPAHPIHLSQEKNTSRHFLVLTAMFFVELKVVECQYLRRSQRC